MCYYSPADADVNRLFITMFMSNIGYIDLQSDNPTVEALENNDTLKTATCIDCRLGMISAGSKSSIRLYDLNQKKVIKEITQSEGDLLCVQWNPCLPMLVSTSNKGKVAIHY